jgi:hypothetical protein
VRQQCRPGDRDPGATGRPDPRSPTPVDWQPGDRIIVAPTMSTDDARKRFEDVEEVRPYLRWAKQPQT